MQGSGQDAGLGFYPLTCQHFFWMFIDFCLHSISWGWVGLELVMAGNGYLYLVHGECAWLMPLILWPGMHKTLHLE